MKASVYKQYGDAAIMNIVLESLPKVKLLKDYAAKNTKQPFLPDRRRSCRSIGQN